MEEAPAVQADPAPAPAPAEEAAPKPELDAGAGAAAAAPPPPVVPPPEVKPDVKAEEEEAEAPAVVSDEQIVESLRALLAAADMATTTGELFFCFSAGCVSAPSPPSCRQTRFAHSSSGARACSRTTRTPAAKRECLGTPTALPSVGVEAKQSPRLSFAAATAARRARARARLRE